jgi:branched-chain amino acid transport system permease protein
VRLPRVEIVGPVADAWNRLPRAVRWGVTIAFVAFLFVLPSLTIPIVDTPGSAFASVLFFPIGIYVLISLGLNVVVGEAGLLDLGYVAFFAIGGYAMALLGTKTGLPFFVILPLGIVASMAGGLILGTPTLRLRGDYLAIVTLGFGEIIRLIANNTDAIGGPRGINQIPHPPSVGGLKFGVIDPKPYYWLLLVLIMFVALLVRNLQRSRVGRAWTAIREDEDAAELMGVATFKYKLWAFAIGAGIGGSGGVMYASKVISITPDNFVFNLSILFLSAVVLGGAGNMPGVVLGAVVVAYLPERFRGFQEYRVLVFGAALVAMMIFRPQGLLPSRRRAAELRRGDQSPDDVVGGEEVVAT